MMAGTANDFCIKEEEAEEDQQLIETKCGEIMMTHQCEHCQLLFKTWDELRLHKKTHPREKPRQTCDTCGLQFSKKEYLRKHMLKEHDVILEKGRCGRKSKFKTADGDPKPFKCSECVREFAKYKPYNRHLKTHQKRFCNFCQDYVTTYAEHMRKVHNFEVPRNFMCDICQRTYRTKSDIVMHMKVHIHMLENRTFACKMCERTFYFNHDLRRHMKSHSLLRPIICDICGESFKTSETLKTHMRRHTGEKPFKCSFCTRSFSTSGSLNIHVRTHTNERPHQCDICQKAFKDASTMNVHKRQHSGESPYLCHLCGRRTKQASNLRSHYRHFHKNTEISGRQIRLNSRVFARYAQEQLDEQLRNAGDLMALLAKGMEEYQAEQCARQEAEEQMRMRLGISELTPKTPDADDISGPPEPYSSPARIKPEPNVVEPPPKRITRANQSQAKVNAHKIDQLMQNLYTPAPITTPDFNDVLEHFELSQTNMAILNNCSNEIKRESSFDKQQSLDHQTTANQIDQKPILPILIAHIESVFVDDFAEPCATPMPEIKTEKIDFDDGFDYNVPSQENLSWNQPNPTTDIKKEEPFAIVPQIKTDIEHTTLFDSPAETKIFSDDSSDSFSSIINSEGIAKSQANDNSAADKPPKKSQTTKRESEMASTSNYNPRRSTCYVCGLDYKNRDAHLKLHHAEIERPYECFICHRNYKKLYAVRQHMMIHSNSRNTICHMCGNAYFNNSDLKKHILSAHTTARPHKCEQCGKAFKTHYGMLVHERSHSGLKPFKCNMCLESFSAVTSLKTHERRHTGEKPFVCKFCGKGFSDSSTHRQHERVHTGEKPYVCHLCGRRTVQAGNLKSHYRHYHKIIVKNVSMYIEQPT